MGNEGESDYKQCHTILLKMSNFQQKIMRHRETREYALHTGGKKRQLTEIVPKEAKTPDS